MPNVIPIHSTKGGLFRSRGKLSAKAINQAVRTVRVKSVGNRWLVKKVAAPKMWSFQNRDTALAKAIELATPVEWNVVVHGVDGRIIKVISPDEFAKPLEDFGLERRPSRVGLMRRRRYPHPAAAQPA